MSAWTRTKTCRVKTHACDAITEQTLHSCDITKEVKQIMLNANLIMVVDFEKALNKKWLLLLMQDYSQHV